MWPMRAFSKLELDESAARKLLGSAMAQSIRILHRFVGCWSTRPSETVSSADKAKRVKYSSFKRALSSRDESSWMSVRRFSISASLSPSSLRVSTPMASNKLPRLATPIASRRRSVSISESTLKTKNILLHTMPRDTKLSNVRCRASAISVVIGPPTLKVSGFRKSLFCNASICWIASSSAIRWVSTLKEYPSFMPRFVLGSTMMLVIQPMIREVGNALADRKGLLLACRQKFVWD
mmetsp:Transcript_29008/g.70054  ORF Transcript_29008/g.70054 Transcript_29008/m.70054 type:complete len:236 (+) Transcript_29008:1001-1708(+)